MNQLNKSLLYSDEHSLLESPLDGTSILGMYNPMQFVLRLRKDIKEEIETISPGIHGTGGITKKQIEAFSTYLHETVHWWQHVGSNYGFITSLIFPVQAHIAKKDLDSLIDQDVLVKSIKKFCEAGIQKSNNVDNPEVNRILNNWYDLYFAGLIGYDPTTYIREIVKNEYFDSVGHSYHMLWSSAIQTLASTFDRDFKFLPNILKWSNEFRKLREEKEEGYYFGSRVVAPSLGTKAIFEGQARFCQLQYLHFSLNKNVDIADFESEGLMSGIYGKAFQFFLKTIDANLPESIDHPIVGLFLLVCDLSINNCEGFPLDIYHFASFLLTVDPGLRFTLLCSSIRDNHPELKNVINSYSREEYITVSQILSKEIACIPPLLASELITKWIEKEPSISQLLKEETEFSFKPENLPVRLFFSKYLRYQADKFLYPHFFCWPGVCFTTHKQTGMVLSKTKEIFDKHQALFLDGLDGDIYPSIFEGKKEMNIMDSFNNFYKWNSTYDMIRQWIIKEGEFTYNFDWLTTKYSKDETKKWVVANFEEVFGIKPEDLKVL